MELMFKVGADIFVAVTLFIFIYNIVYSFITLLFIIASSFSLSDFVMNRVSHEISESE